jgi:hypothetical protein
MTPAPVGAQEPATVSGVVLEDGSEVPIGSAEIHLLDTVGRIRARTTASEEGFFLLEFRPAHEAWYRLRAQRIGYSSATSPRFRIAPSERVDTEIRLLVDAVLVTPLTVTGRRRTIGHPGLEAFQFRASRGVGGHFITRDDIAERRPFYLSDMLSSVPGVRLGPSQGGGGRMVFFSRANPREGGCAPQIFLDGRLMNQRILTQVSGARAGTTSYRTDTGIRIDEFVSVMSVEGVEVYPGMASIPPEFYTPDARCGVIAIWTRIH